MARTGEQREEAAADWKRRTGGRWVVALLSTAAALTFSFGAAAQLFGRSSTVVQNVRILVGDGSVIESGSILIQGGRITAVGSQVSVPQRARVIDAAGLVATPGLIDVLGGIGNTSSGGSSADMRAIDAFDFYLTDDLTEAVAHGVTTMYVPARGGAGVIGLGATVRLTSNAGGSMGEALNDESALCIDLDSGSAAQRLRVLSEVRKQFKGALDLRKAKQWYEEDLSEYEAKVKERAAKKEKAEETEKNAEQSGEAKPEEKKEEKKEELKKPTPPSRNSAAEVLLRAIDGEIPVRIRANRSGDILNATQLASEFGLSIIIEGGFDAGDVARHLADANIAVVFESDAANRINPASNDRAIDEQVIAMRHAGVEYAIGSGGGEGGRFLLMQVQGIAVSPSSDAIRMLTSHAAAMIGAEGEIGRIAPGRRADIVLWTGDPLDPQSQVDRVLVDGRAVYERSAVSDEGGAE